MRVLVSEAAEEWAHAYATVMAGPEGEVVYLSHMGVRSLNRPLSPAEIDAIRRAVRDVPAGSVMSPRPAAGAYVGYVCTGRVLNTASMWLGDAGVEDAAISGGGSAETVGGNALVAVSDHADLTYRAPLWGPNRDEVGPRFPALAGLYRPEVVKAVFPQAVVGDVAEVNCPHCPSAFEALAMQRVSFMAATNQLASLAILAAHAGYGLAVLLVCDGKDGSPT